LKSSKILAEVTVDEELTLQILTGEKTPWIVLLNGKAKKRRNVRLGWFESPRPVRLGGRGPCREYSVADIDGALASLLAEFFSSVAVQAIFWQTFRFLQNSLHRTSVVVEVSDCKLLPDSKRDTLWLAYIPHQSPHGLVRHTFPLSGTEKPQIERFLSGEEPWPALELTSREARGSLASMPFVRDLNQTEPSRWLRPLMLAVAGALLGFQDGSAGVECDFADSLWQGYYASQGRFDPAASPLVGEEVFLAEMRGLLRLWPYLESIAYERAFDGQEFLQERGYSRRERFAALLDISGRRQFVVTRFIGDDGALLLSPQRPGPGEKDRILHFPQETFDAIGKLNSEIGILDSEFALTQLWRSWRRFRGQKRLNGLLELVPLFGRTAPAAEPGKGERDGAAEGQEDSHVCRGCL